MKTKTLINKEDNRKALLAAMFATAGWKIYEEEVIKASLDSVAEQFRKLTEVAVSQSDLPRLNELIRQKKFLENIQLMAEPLKEEVSEKSPATV